jgi:hypothetical protein
MANVVLLFGALIPDLADTILQVRFHTNVVQLTDSIKDHLLLFTGEVLAQTICLDLYPIP